MDPGWIAARVNALASASHRSNADEAPGQSQFDPGDCAGVGEPGCTVCARDASGLVVDVSRAAYHRKYYARTAERRRRLANHRGQCKTWTAWLLGELRSTFATPLIDRVETTPRIQPLRRPT